VIYTARAPQLIITDRIIHQRRVNVWAGMGLGKTGATLDALNELDLVDDGPTLTIGPLRVAEVTWPDEVLKWDHLSDWRVSPVLGDPGARKKALLLDANLFTVNFENVPWLVEHFGGRKRWPFKRVIFDECTRLGGFRLRQGSKQAKALGQVAHAVTERWVNLTGTPAPNGLLGLWGQTWFVDAGERLGHSFDAFKQRWFHTYNEKGHWEKNPEFKVPVIRPTDWALDEIEARLADITIALNPKDFFDLKDPIKTTVRVRLPPKARALYRDMEKRMFMEIAGTGIEAFQAAQKSLKCLQLASGGAFDNDGIWHEVHDAKLQALDSICQEATGANVLAVYHWKPTLARLLKAFPKARHIKDAQSIRDWQAGKIALGFVHPASVGHGQSLQDGGNIIAHVDHWWDFEKHDQINERLGPMRQFQSGYERPVWEYYIVAEDTADELVMLRHETKRSVQSLLTEAAAARGLM
jgi:hypothetical protein